MWRTQALVVASGSLAVWGKISTTRRISACESHAASLRVPAFSATYPANDPSEDRSVVCSLGTKANGDVVKMVGVFDGHGGWQVSEFVSKNVQEVLTRHLTEAGVLVSTTATPAPVKTTINKADDSDEERVEEELMVGRALRTSFAELEARYKDGVRQSYAYGFGQVARVGCCALVCLRIGDRLSLANAGDCRAVLGSATDDGGTDFRAVRITRDHNAREPLEVIRLMTEHPGESLQSLIRCKNPHACYVKGRLQLSRALGDAYLKYPEYNAPPGQHRDRGRHIAPPYTPPYVDAVPQLHHLVLQSQRDRFVVLASDGVWDYLTDQDAVDVVAQARRAGMCPAEAIRTAALTKAAEECGMSLEELLQFPPGRQRRGRHDDTTAVVLEL